MVVVVVEVASVVVIQVNHNIIPKEWGHGR